MAQPIFNDTTRILARLAHNLCIKVNARKNIRKAMCKTPGLPSLFSNVLKPVSVKEMDPIYAQGIKQAAINAAAPRIDMYFEYLRKPPPPKESFGLPPGPLLIPHKGERRKPCSWISINNPCHESPYTLIIGSRITDAASVQWK